MATVAPPVRGPGGIRTHAARPRESHLVALGSDARATGQHRTQDTNFRPDLTPRLVYAGAFSL